MNIVVESDDEHVGEAFLRVAACVLQGARESETAQVAALRSTSLRKEAEVASAGQKRGEVSSCTVSGIACRQQCRKVASDVLEES